MAKKKDFYELLGVDNDCSQADIKAAYRRLARKFHPDVNPGDEKAAHRFKEVKEAYDVLKNPLTRDKFDQYGHAGLDPSFQTQTEESFVVTDMDAEPLATNDLFKDSGIDDIYNVSEMRGGKDAAITTKPGADLRYRQSLSP
jgi:DnaJ-class molecular chaperone